ncbi:Pre-mRNA-splicing factor srp2 [Hypsizygus marmoreus]|uniref:Pre-mRNA-splicing factor srp2 n=1 Tax=Hypsizygus marmoreus TaxID=39966 RepID=A0A369JLZ8_HYPMA|nr:Pre-mRNA-splicing factor srp2 [Hypsizygus marmoreus]
MARRLYLGRLPTDARSEDVNKFFEGYGRIIDCRVMTVMKDAEDAVHNLNGKPFMGVTSIVVEFAKESRPRRDVYEGDRNHGAPRSRRPPGIRLIVSGVSRDTSWQDLKDFGRDAGSVSFADIDRDTPGQGILEYLNRDDADRAVKELDGKELRGRPVRVALDDSRAGPDNYRRDDRRDDRPPRDDRYRDDRGRDDRGSYRRDRSRSPPRRAPAEYDDRRPRSPPPRREVDDRRPAGYDDYRRGGYDDRRGPDYYVDRRRDDLDRRRDDRRRDEKDERFDERAPRHANGDSGNDGVRWFIPFYLGLVSLLQLGVVVYADPVLLSSSLMVNTLESFHSQI